MAKEPSDEKTLSRFGTTIFGAYLIVLVAGLSIGLNELMKSITDPPTELELIQLVIIVGALGSYVHAATSFASYVGNQRLGRSWLWWYILRPFIGASLALIFYFVIRAGFLQTTSDTADVSLFGIAALAGLTGMFSKQATDKLRELFDHLFSTKDERADKLSEASAPKTENQTEEAESDEEPDQPDSTAEESGSDADSTVTDSSSK